jgi:RecA-family ATPase
MGEAFQIPPDSGLTHMPAQVAASWARAGFPVFPCGPDKRPLTPHGFKDATADLEAVAAFWQAYPKALVGLPTGAASGLFVVDLDIDKDTGEAAGEASLAALGLSHLIGDVPTVATPSGGRHLYFRDCGLGNTAGKLGPKIDTRGTGGYVIAPGSVTPAGAYVLLNGSVTPEALSPLPAPFLSRLRANPLQVQAQAAFRIDTGAQAAGWAEAALQGELGRVMAAREGERNHALNRAAFSLAQIIAGGGLEESATRARLLSAALANGLSEAEALATIASGIGAGMVSPRTAPERTPVHHGGQGYGGEAGADAQPEAAPLPFFCAADLHGQTVPVRQWHVVDFIPARTVTILAGDGGTGKSLAALQLAVATARGTPWLGQATTEGCAVFISAEDERDELHRRLAAVAVAEGFPLADLDKLTCLSLAAADALMSVPEGAGKTMKETPLFRKIEEWLSIHKPAVTVLDTLADLFGGDEINRGQARQFIGQLRGLALKHGTTIILLAHPSLSGMARGDGNSGSTAWNNSVRSRLYMRRAISEDGAEADPDARTLEVMKANYGRIGLSLSLRYRDGAFAAVGTAGAPDAKATAAKADRVFGKLLRECHANGRRVNHTGGNSYAPKVFASLPDAEGVTKNAFRRAMETALANKTAKIEAEGPPSRRVSFLVPGDAP